MEGGDYIVRHMKRRDVLQAQALARTVWAEQAYRDTGVRIEYPQRVRRMFEGYLRAEPRGSFVAEDGGRVIGAAYGHKWGDIGWMGPIEVLPEFQKMGVGTALAEATIGHLEVVGCNVVGVETMGESDAHVAFYKRLGFTIHSPAFFYEKRLPKDIGLSGETMLLPIRSYQTVLTKVKALSDKICKGLDLSVEFWMAYIANLGRILIYQDQDDPEKLLGAAIIYGRTMEGVDNHLLRLMIVDPSCEDPMRVAGSLLQDVEFLVRRMKGSRIFFSSSVTESSVNLLADHGYRVIGNNVRMVRGKGYGERGALQIISWAG